MQLRREEIDKFHETIWDYYRDQGRHDLLWRQPDAEGRFDPYKILVSEMMLQQTQVSRVLPKYVQFLRKYPAVHDLSRATLADVLAEWQGLGYNRRAKFLWQAAQLIDGMQAFPETSEELVKLPGIGLNTAAAVLVYSFNQPLTFIETNIRTVFIHHYYQDDVDVADKDILALVSQTIDKEHPREWYWALMDYGSYLKATVGNISRLSKSYTKQSSFVGSNRQIRGMVIRTLIGSKQTKSELEAIVQDERLATVLVQLQTEDLIRYDGTYYVLGTRSNMLQ